MSTSLDPRYAIQAFAHANAFNPAPGTDGEFVTTPTDGESDSKYDHLHVSVWPSQVSVETRLRDGYAVLAIGTWPKDVALFVDDPATARKLLSELEAIVAHLTTPKAD